MLFSSCVPHAKSQRPPRLEFILVQNAKRDLNSFEHGYCFLWIGSVLPRRRYGALSGLFFRVSVQVNWVAGLEVDRWALD